MLLTAYKKDRPDDNLIKEVLGNVIGLNDKWRESNVTCDVNVKKIDQTSSFEQVGEISWSILKNVCVENGFDIEL